ncbi:DUF305 domain-containing protein [Streptomyces sp. NBC_00474]|uniref:DUF305 domain-containing protein n=1 Tax=Streptomyces sp. NBC_00474 TaxID=2975754 RepID=UPI00225B0F6A|nr:DUF305 domain-containing protein [Streptomyces sp. NBC_00474]MCX5051643.1 DUF305 domain-containing protein [Streptomyces sp. NBC_00474]
MRNTRTFMARRATLAAATVTAALVLAACGNDGDSDNGGQDTTPSASASSSASSSSSSTAHNAQDVAFAQGMIPHHQQALEMARLAAGRASSAKVQDLASRIEKAQDPEIRTMSGWLKGWGEKVPSAMPGMDHSAHSGKNGTSGTTGMSGMSGMMDGKDIDKLEKASGKAFDTMFLTMMTEHHEGAVEMAGTEKDKGAYGPAIGMADDIVTGQTAEITEMNKLLGKS